MVHVYSIFISDNPSIEIPQGKLRSLVEEIEGELHCKQLYCRALVYLQKLLGKRSRYTINFIIL